MSTIVTEPPRTPVADPLEAIPTMPIEPERRATLLKAAELIDEHGWCTGRFKNHRGQMCVRGAVFEALGALVYDKTYGGWLPGDGYGDRGDFPVFNLDPKGPHPATWNNALPEGSGPVVAKALRKMADGASFEEATA